MEDLKLLTVAEVAETLRVSKMTIYRLCQSGRLKSVRVGRAYRVPERALDAYLNETQEVAIPNQVWRTDT